ncbi:ATP-binding protein [uncultured Oxalicibacterium sp.]|uniref:cache domain-containing sensor histidine kinase n=1 Tax=uncultured Oxalicibacterium sp. TaxID=1168540 RepID=UPI0025F1BA58|nr:ATP-binding protein [uncultured Oxalicibacterium sp.]
MQASTTSDHPEETGVRAAWQRWLGRIQEVDTRLFLVAFAASLIAGLWVLTLQQLRHAEQDEMRHAERDAVSFARLFKEHATRTIESADQATVYLRHRFNTAGMNLDVMRDLQDGLTPDGIYNLFTITDRKGDVVFSSQPFTPVNLADREHIRVHMESDKVGLFISKPVLGRVSKKWSLQMTRRISYPDGSFKGVVVASMNPQYFMEVYKEIDIGQQGSISLIGMDGVIRVRQVGNHDNPDQDVSFGQDVSQSPVFKAAQNNAHGLIRTQSVVDGRDRLYAFEKLQQYPLYVVVGIDLEERLQSYSQIRAQSMLLSGLATIVIVLATIGLILLIGRLMASRQDALVALRAKRHFLSNMSHEFRTPLGGILGYSETLMEDFADTRHGLFAKAIHQSGQRLLRMVDSLLEVSMLRSGEARIQLSDEKIADIVMSAISRHSAAAIDKHLKLSADIRENVPAVVHCDRAKLIQILDKLLDNAIRFTDHGSITLRLEWQNDELAFHIIDTGRGIPFAAQKRIFEKFSQVDDSPARRNDGAGLGLTIATLLIELMNGRISVQSTPDQGSTFSFVLPLQKA